MVGNIKEKNVVVLFMHNPEILLKLYDIFVFYYAIADNNFISNY